MKDFWKEAKYRNVKTEYNGYVYMSKKEAGYAQQLDQMMKAKDPKDRVVSFERQVPYLLQESFIDKDGKKHREITYIADFVVKYEDGREEVQDIKGSKNFTTDIYKIKKKILLFKYRNISFKEIY